MLQDHDCLGPHCKTCKLGIIEKPKKKRTSTQLRNNSKAQERSIAKGYQEAGFAKARRVPGSGAFSSLPMDVDPGELLMLECKMTRTGKMTIQPDWLQKAERQAREMGRPFYALHAWVSDQTHPFEKWVVVREDYFLEILRRLNAAEAELRGE